MANEIEQQEMANIPQKYRPLGMWAFFGYTILFSLPIVGLILALVFAFNNNNVCRRNFARSYFCILIISIVLVFALAAMGVTYDTHSMTLSA